MGFINEFSYFTAPDASIFFHILLESNIGKWPVKVSVNFRGLNIEDYRNMFLTVFLALIDLTTRYFGRWHIIF